jgi:probable HAF family extracellular repeat protein
MKTKLHVSKTAAAFTVALLSSVVAARGENYRLVDLSKLTGVPSIASGINDKGHITGCGTLEAPLHGFCYDSAVQDIGTLGGAESFGKRLNAFGWVAGSAQNADGMYHAVIYRDGRLEDLGTLKDRQRSYGLDINDAGFVTGYSDNFELANSARAFVFDGTRMSDLGTLGGLTSHGTCINSAGQVAGYAQTSQIYGFYSPTHAFRWAGGVMQDLGTLGGTTSAAWGINSSGWVVGTSTISRNLGDSHAFLYRDGKMYDLGTLGGRFSAANDINDKGIIVGNSTIDDTHQHAFIYRDGVMSDLNAFTRRFAPDWVIVDALGINACGQVVGVAVNPIGNAKHAVLLNPAPALTLVKSAEGIVISWPWWATDFALYGTTDTLPPIVWSPITNAVTSLEGTGYSVSVPTSDPRHFFRLMAR